ncbi:MAG TPA: hypothetical protein VH088_23590 [Terriglobales bacterium]|jgi:hypothetical protein|nr:hypothetical protein [Terriglobales bacterium]
MTNIRMLAGAVALFTTVSAAQQVPQNKPLGDVAREQQQTRKQEKKASADRVYKEIGTAAPDKTSSEPAGDPFRIAPIHRSIFDQAKTNQPDFIIVPAGAEIRVDIVEAKVIGPVRVGFSTPIPALSIAAVKMIQNYYSPVSYNLNSGKGNPPVAYGESAELTSVVVRGVSYPVQARPVSLSGGATFGTLPSSNSSRDAVFVLTAPLAIQR